MFRSFPVLLFCCVGFSVVQATFTEDYEILLDDIFTTEYPDYNFPGILPTETPWETHFNWSRSQYDQVEPVDCGPNEVLECTNSCPPELTCKDRGEEVTAVPCPEEVQSCENKCVCEPGFFRNTKYGVCVTEKQCDKCPGPNEHLACGGPCDDICDTLHLYSKYNCPGYNDSDCQPSCYCDAGYARDASGVCIPKHECPIPKCGQNEVFTECKKSCSNDTCSALMNPSICDSEEECGNLGCVCKDGYFRIEEKAPCLPFCECPHKKDSIECLYTGKKLSYYLSKLLGY